MVAYLSQHPASNLKSEISNDLLVGLRQDFLFRRIKSATNRLETHRAVIELLDPAQKNAAPLLGLLAQWVDIEFIPAITLRELLSRFRKDLRATLPVYDYVHLRVAEALCARAEGLSEKAIRGLEIALTLEEEIDCKDLVILSNYWIGRCYRRLGRYDDALRHAVKVKELALELGYNEMAAFVGVLESWAILKRGKPKQAASILGEAEAVLLKTDDCLALGNIQSAYGRIARFEGRYDAALVYFEKAIEEFKRMSPQHRHVARSLVNMSFVKRLIAIRLQNKVDNEIGRRGRVKAARATIHKLGLRQYIDHLREEAKDHLAKAEEIYERAKDNVGKAMVHINRGHLYLDSGELDCAGPEGAKGHQLGQENEDFIVLARARILQSLVENAMFEEQIEEVFDVNQHARLAHQMAREAIECAERSENRYLLGRAFITEGMVLSNEFFNDTDGARRSADRAIALLKPEGHDYLWENLQALESRVYQTRGVNSLLSEWSRGVVCDKTFQEITEEFAGIIIPRIWELEGRKISRVAARLSISPKKVRRILSSKGLLTRASRSLRSDS